MCTLTVCDVALACRQSNPQGSVQPFAPVTGPSAWVAADYRDNEKWIYRLSAEDIQELDSAIAQVIASGARIQVRYFWT